MRHWTAIYIFTCISGAYKVGFLALLPALYGLHVIDIGAVGWIGSLFIAAMIAGALLIERSGERLSSLSWLRTGVVVSLIATPVLYASFTGGSIPGIALAFILMGLSAGFTQASLNAVTGAITIEDERFSTFAQLAMLKDVMRIIMPILIGFLAVRGFLGASILVFVAFTAVGGVALRWFPKRDRRPSPADRAGEPLRTNKAFRAASITEFFDGFASSTLFVFVPLIFLVRGYAIDDSIYLQAMIFIGYLVGRWTIAALATRSNGWRALGIAELGMALCIVLLLAVESYAVLVVVCILLGIFTRGTSPVIKALAINALTDRNLKRGTAIYSIIGDVGAMSGQFVFGLLVAYVAVQAPFVLSALVAISLAAYCLGTMPTWKRSS